jgi:hypothetical protein
VRAALVAIGLAIAATAGAAPTVEIKAQTQLSLSSVKLQPDGSVEVSGQLVDKLTGEGIPKKRVSVIVAGEARSATTDASGTFTVYAHPAPGPQKITLEFRGDAKSHVDAALPLDVTTDPAKQQVALALAKIEDTPDGVRLVVTAKVDNAQVVVPVAIAIGAASDADLAPQRTETSSQPFVVRRADVGGAGAHRARATFAGDDTRQAAKAELTFDLVSTTTTSMSVSAQKLAFEDDLVVTGKVTDDDDRPVARAAVTLAAGDRRLAQGATGDDGSYRLRVEASVLGEGQFGVQVNAEPAKSYVRPSRSAPQIVQIAAPSPVPVSYTFAAFIATAIAAGGFFLARAKPWQRLRRPVPPAEVPSEQGEIAQVGGVVLAKPSIVSTLRRPSDDGFSGVVRDTVRGRPIAEAVVRLALGEEEREVCTGGDGAFAFAGLASGTWRAEAAAPGHITEMFAVTIPHRGELRGVRVDLVPVRERVFQLYRRAAEPILPEPRLWGIWSPRQIVDHVRAKRPSPALAELTDFVEEVYFSARPSAETVLPVAEGRVDRAIRERAGL